MSTNAFLQSIADSKSLLEESGLLIHSNHRMTLPSDYISRLRELSYYEQWNMHNEMYWYQLKIDDQSLFFFKEDSFKYMMSPFANLLTQEEFQQDSLKNLIRDGYSEAESMSLIEEGIDKDYSDYLDTESSFKVSTPVRLDIHPDQYHPTHHPVTHLHIGHDNESRIPVKKIMTPFSFVGFIVATFYPEAWKRLVRSGYLNAEQLKRLKGNLNIVSKIHSGKWCAQYEETRFYLG
jgi:hypothetical protein